MIVLFNRLMGFLVALVIFGSGAFALSAACWAASQFVALRPLDFPWVLLRVLLVIAALFSLMFACSDEARGS